MAALAASGWASTFAIDFSVYWTICRSAIGDGGGLYGEASRLPWPMWYRYPPLFAWLLWPLSLLPFRAAAFLWALGKLVALAAVLRELGRRVGATAPMWGLAALAGLPWVLMELRYGNAQGAVFALTAAALLGAGKRPRLAAAGLGLAAALKVWPLFFVPYLAARRRWAVAAGATVWAAALTLAPAAWTGWAAHAAALGDWWAQESAIASRGGSIWFPSQSLLGVMTRHWTALSWKDQPDPNYPLVNWLALDPAWVRGLWLALAAAGCLALWRWARRLPPEAEPSAAAAALCALALLEPYAQRQTALVVLAWPALVAAAAAYRRGGRPRTLFAAAVALVWLQPLTPSAWWQRVYEVWGLDALAAVLLLAASAGGFTMTGVGGSPCPNRSSSTSTAEHER